MEADVHGVLFDLDGTLLDIELGRFLETYFASLETAIGPVTPGVAVIPALSAATQRMMSDHPGRTNAEVFWEDFERRTGVPEPAWRPSIDRFYDHVFPGLSDTFGPMPGARRAVETAMGLGLRVALATNPIFPEVAVRHRLAWAGLDDLPFDVVTTYEVMHACKPAAAYYLETAELLGVPADDCLMVGDDRGLDLPASDVGMRTFYVGGVPAAADWSGDLTELAGLLPRLAAGDDD
jgi:FMN phosphatase YigB (HAD superfamily)